MSEPLARPRGCRSLAERSSNAAELIAPADTTTTSAEYRLGRLAPLDDHARHLAARTRRSRAVDT